MQIDSSANIHCVKSVQIRIFSGPYFPAFGLNTERYGDTPYLSVFSPNAGKYGPEKTPYLDIFHAVQVGSKKNKKVAFSPRFHMFT